MPTHLKNRRPLYLTLAKECFDETTYVDLAGNYTGDWKRVNTFQVKRLQLSQTEIEIEREQHATRSGISTTLGELPSGVLFNPYPRINSTGYARGKTVSQWVDWEVWYQKNLLPKTILQPNSKNHY